MLCPVCEGKTTVKDSRKEVDCINRRRECIKCGFRFNTVEVDADYFNFLQRKEDKNECN